MSKKERIAIVGLDCRYAGAHSINEYWENILSLRQQFRRIPDKRLNLDYYGSPDHTNTDSTYSKNAAVISGYHFDRLKYRISQSTYEQTDLAHWLALDVAAGALKDAGFEDGNSLNKEKVGVVIGNSLTGEFTRANVMRLRWPYVSRVLHSSLSSMGFHSTDIREILNNTEALYKQPFPVPNADMLAGGLSNTIAGRICNYFDFNGGGYTVDGACSSSLLAIANACNAILNGEADVMLAGGVDLSIDAFEVIGFARNGALAPLEMEVFSGKSQGFWPGEGCGIIVLMKESEAIKNGHNIYGIITGWGISSDGKGGMTRPKAEAQQLAMERAYQRAGYEVSSVSLFEAHGTGTQLGDEIEIASILNTIKKYSTAAGTPAVLGSVKQLIGHTKAAAGIAGLIKSTLALKHKILPASIITRSVNPLLKKNNEYLTMLDKPQIWDNEKPLRAGVSSFGFGGINVHITVEEDNSRERPARIPPMVRQLSRSRRDAEIFPITGTHADEMLQKLQTLHQLARSISRAEFIDLSMSMVNTAGKPGKYRAGIVAANPEELFEKSAFLVQKIREGNSELIIDLQQNIFYSATGIHYNNTFLFPGQGAPVLPELSAFQTLNFQFSLPDIPTPETLTEEPTDTSQAQPVIISNTMKALEMLEYYGVKASAGIGHSLGEIAALSWAGSFNAATAVEIAALRGRIMSDYGEKEGAMLALKCSEKELKGIINGHDGISITGYNGINSYVVGGKSTLIDEVQRTAFDREIQSVRLKVSHAFHTPLMKESALQFKQALSSFSLRKVTGNVVSTVTGQSIKGSQEINNHLFAQIEQPVLFRQAIESIRHDNLFFFEVGPGTTLTRSLQGYEDMHVIPIDFGGHHLQGFLGILAAAFISGNDINFRELSSKRHYQHFDIEKWHLDVFENPCETITHGQVPEERRPALQTIAGARETATELSGQEITAAEAQEQAPASIMAYLKQQVSEKMEMPVELISDEDRIMSQLHINSLAITEIISKVTKTFGKSHKTFSSSNILASADGSIREIAQMIEAGEGITQQQKGNGAIDFDKLYNWTHIFKRHDIPRTAGKKYIARSPGEVVIEGDPHWCSILEAEQLLLSSDNGDTAVFVYESDNQKPYLAAFLQFLQNPSITRKKLIVLVDICEGPTVRDLKPVFRSFQLEAPHVQALSIQINRKVKDPALLLLNEIRTATRYKEVSFGQEGNRTESACTVCFPAAGDIKQVITPSDVILATGAGKGITFESVREIATITNARLAIIGRSDPATDTELSGNLQQLTTSGITYRYYMANVLDQCSIQATVDAISQELGTITVLIHGAGMNKPNRIENLTINDFERTTAVKVTGLKNVADSIDMSKMKLVAGYGSVIAQSGMQGNADYAWANDQMALYIAQLGGANPQGRFITLEWSVWEETGMGIALNSIDWLKSEGIYPIPVKQGLQQLNNILADPSGENGRFMILGRFSKMPTLAFNKRNLSTGRFISGISHHIPNVEVIADVSIDLKNDPYLLHHQLDGQYIMPMVMLMEGMVQVAQVLHSSSENISIQQLQIERAIFVPREGSRAIRFVAVRIAEQAINVAVYSDETDFEKPCVETIISYTCGIDDLTAEEHLPDSGSLDMDVASCFYDELLFHTGPFRRIRQFHKISALAAVAQTVKDASAEKWFGTFLPEDKLLGDPGLNDAAIHCHQACRPSQTLLPVRIGEIQFNTGKVAGPFFISTTELYEEGNDTTINVVVFNEQGQIKMRWKALVLRRITGRDFSGKWHPVFLKPYLEYTLNHLSVSNKQTMISLNSCQEILNAVVKGEEPPAMQTSEFLLKFKAATLSGTDDDEVSLLTAAIPLSLNGSRQSLILKVTSAVVS